MERFKGNLGTFIMIHRKVGEQSSRQLQRCNEPRGTVRYDYHEHQRCEFHVGFLSNLSQQGGCINERFKLLKPY
ncbi:hypothetical protein Csa_004946 [Cucumis sativus]|uniref:Uncharacterized protein n=1 Tax=Cucumis sativus TaxID=3659 RepID=A0A0A0K829_CUCSA|nr:hypothetical protein Csa_004946 [Cucumis sativus]